MARKSNIQRAINATTGVSRMYQAASDVGTRYGRNPTTGRFSNRLRAKGHSRIGRRGQVISRRQRYYDMRVAFGMAGG